MKPATHERCLYAGRDPGTRILFLRQVDDFAAAAKTKAAAITLFHKINASLRINLKILGRVEHFNGMDIHQTKDFIKITCEKYLYKMLNNHGWLATTTTPTSDKPIPLPSDNHFMQALENATPPNTESERKELSAKMGFHYRQVIGEVMYPMTKCRLDVAFHITKLSQYMDNPAEEHYLAFRQLCRYLASTINEGIYYWRLQPHTDLPPMAHPSTLTDNYSLEINPTQASPTLYGYVDADWASDTSHRKSITGIILMYAGGVVGYRTRFQDTIAHSSTKAKFTAACDAGKLILYFRSLLEDMHIPQQTATILYEDNNGALLMANAQQPTRRTRHMDIKKFALLEWVEQYLLLLQSIKSSDNAADAMTKSLTKQLFYRHSDTIMGRRVPQYVTQSDTSSSLTCFNNQNTAKSASRPSKHGGGGDMRGLWTILLHM
jgi:hypothetical protein